MSEKRFKGYAEKTGRHHELIIIDLLGEEYSITDDFFKSKDVIFDIVDLLNVMNDTLLKQADENHNLSNKNIEQQATITKLEQICEKKMQEIENIKYSLKEIAYKYQKEVQFKADTDPNQAVKEVLCEQQATISRLEEENEQLRRLFEEMKQPITVNLTEEDEKELRKLLGIDCDE